MRQLIEELKSITERKSEKDVAKGMKKKGYEYILLVQGRDALYAKTMQNATELMRTDLKKEKVNIMMIDKFLKEDKDESSEEQLDEAKGGKVDDKYLLSNLKEAASDVKAAQSAAASKEYTKVLYSVHDVLSALNSGMTAFSKAEPSGWKAFRDAIRKAQAATVHMELSVR